MKTAIKVSAIAAGALLVLPFAPVGAAAVKIGSKCTKTGATATDASGTALVCTVKGRTRTFQKAPVGYVTCIRESSVVIAAFVGARYLGEGQVVRRVTAACVVVVGLLLLVIGQT